METTGVSAGAMVTSVNSSKSGLGDRQRCPLALSYLRSCKHESVLVEDLGMLALGVRSCLFQ